MSDQDTKVVSVSSGQGMVCYQVTSRTGRQTEGQAFACQQLSSVAPPPSHSGVGRSDGRAFRDQFGRPIITNELPCPPATFTSEIRAGRTGSVCWVESVQQMTHIVVQHKPSKPPPTVRGHGQSRKHREATGFVCALTRSSGAGLWFYEVLLTKRNIIREEGMASTKPVTVAPVTVADLFPKKNEMPGNSQHLRASASAKDGQQLRELFLPPLSTQRRTKDTAWLGLCAP